MHSEGCGDEFLREPSVAARGVRAASQDKSLSRVLGGSTVPMRRIARAGPCLSVRFVCARRKTNQRCAKRCFGEAVGFRGRGRCSLSRRAKGRRATLERRAEGGEGEARAFRASFNVRFFQGRKAPRFPLCTCAFFGGKEVRVGGEKQIDEKSLSYTRPRRCSPFWFCTGPGSSSKRAARRALAHDTSSEKIPSTGLLFSLWSLSASRSHGRARGLPVLGEAPETLHGGCPLREKRCGGVRVDPPHAYLRSSRGQGVDGVRSRASEDFACGCCPPEASNAYIARLRRAQEPGSPTSTSPRRTDAVRRGRAEGPRCGSCPRRRSSASEKREDGFLRPHACPDVNGPAKPSHGHVFECKRFMKEDLGMDPPSAS